MLIPQIQLGHFKVEGLPETFMSYSTEAINIFNYITLEKKVADGIKVANLLVLA